ncbi:MAG: DNA recombination protein RmuC [Candidatus Harrisonbacteria bacterium CG10_big_fil_rev_8_21_14_0_10_45_28]|uniref:DNA recombination protein RmuC n=1 Tax=Candidatus Harrisonbacteria bacterium CG10_big_fil_rev_8_21_14_0_10_45_28 TaxID=1974586 RepID=A0A2H0UMA6_9BACT|nr:MAG: DNA recombination protein RmuC [Candidatus Harrisonbacteria bacterium CG10_big_fil_rev_8_21_14_0_10_45_28]
MDLIYFLIILVAVVIGFLAIYFLLVKKKADQPAPDQSMILLQQQIQELNRTLDTKLSDSSKTVYNQTNEMAKNVQAYIKEVTTELIKVGEGQKQVVGFADQLRELQDILKNPKQRGILGEYYLETLLTNILPAGSFQMQYAFKDGLIVDAAVFVKDKVIPIDSKFSLENYNRLVEAKDKTEREKWERAFVNDLKTRIQETGKYIRPNEGTMDFAFMFIPHEAIYYDLLINKVGAVTEDTENLIQRAARKEKVIIVSPTSFLAYLQTVLQGLRALQIEDTAKDIIKRVGELGQHLGRYDTYIKKLGNSLGTTVNAYNTANKELKKIDKDVLRIGGESAGIEIDLIDKPIEDE